MSFFIFYFCRVEITGNNFCESFHINFTTQASEIARQAIEAPLKKNPKYVH